MAVPGRAGHELRLALAGKYPEPHWKHVNSLGRKAIERLFSVDEPHQTQNSAKQAPIEFHFPLTPTPAAVSPLPSTSSAQSNPLSHFFLQKTIDQTLHPPFLLQALFFHLWLTVT